LGQILKFKNTGNTLWPFTTSSQEYGEGGREKSVEGGGGKRKVLTNASNALTKGKEVREKRSGKLPSRWFMPVGGGGMGE